MTIARLIRRAAIILPALLLLTAAQSPARDAATLVRVAVTRDLRVQAPAPWAADDPADSLYRVAREALNTGDYARAARMFADITARYPRSAYAADALYFRAYALYRSGGEADLRRALSALDQQKAEYPKAGTIGDAKELAVRIKGALAQRGDVASAEAVTSAASGSCATGGREGDDMRSEAMNALLQMDAESAVPIIKAVLAKRDACSVSLRKRAVFLIAQKQTPETVTLMLDVVRNDPSPQVRSDAVFWLGQVHGDQAASALEEIVTKSSDSALRERAVFALGQMNTARSAALVRRLAESSETPAKLREQAIFQIGQQPSSANAELLRSLYAKIGTGDDAMRKRVLFSLSQMRGYGNDRWLLNLALDPSQSVEVRKHALWTAGQAGVPGSELVGLYDKIGDRPIKEQLIWVLSQSSDPSASNKLVDIAQHDRDVEMRKKAIFWLGQKNDPRIRQLLLDILTKG